MCVSVQQVCCTDIHIKKQINIPRIHYINLLTHIQPGDYLLYNRDKYFTILGKSLAEPYNPTLWNRLKPCWTILKGN